ncbi:MAG: murein biosynthesis integral membrane protein MurJ [Solirubrobacteraceae bacterium]
MAESPEAPTRVLRPTDQEGLPENHAAARPTPRPPESDQPARPRRVARNTAIFSIATGLSRIAGLVREIVASSYFGVTGRFSAFTIAFQVPNLVRALFADAALSAAFVPVFTELLEQKRRQEAFRLASTLLFVILIVLGAITAFFILAAGLVMPLFIGHTFDHQLTTLTVGLSQVLFPIVVLLGINGLVVGILQTYDHFSIPAIAPVVWNLVIIVVLIALRGHFHGQDQIYAYAIGVLAGTVVQLAMAVVALRRIDFRFEFAFDWRDERVRRVLRLMVPVCLGLGIINFDLLINSSLGTLVSQEAPRAIDAAFRIYMLPQGMFSVAVATVLFPALSAFAARRDIDGLRAAMSNGLRQINLLLVPAAAFIVVLSTPIVRLVFQHGSFGAPDTQRVSTALFWFAFSLPFSGLNLMLTRTFFSLQKTWMPTKLAAVNMVADVIVSLALYKPFGIAGLVIGTAVASAVMTVLQAVYLRRELAGRLEGHQTIMISARILVASTFMAAGAYVVYSALDFVLGRSVAAQIITVGAAAVAGLWLYVRAVLRMRVPEARQMQQLVAARLGRS